jgi:hypothetical protein
MAARDDDEDDDRAAKELLADPLVQETIENTLATYRGVVPEDMLRSLREVLEDALTTDPYAVALVRQHKVRRVPVASDVVVRQDAPPNGSSHGKSNGKAYPLGALRLGKAGQPGGASG